MKIFDYAQHARNVYDFGVDLKNRTIYLNESIRFGHTDIMVISALTLLESLNRKPIILRINSPGGSVTAARAIMSAIIRSRCKVIAEVDGACQSAAILICAVCDERNATNLADFMHHEISTFHGDYTKLTDIKSSLEQDFREQKILNQLLGEYTLKPAKFWEERTDQRTDFHFSAKEAKEYGLIDKVIIGGRNKRKVNGKKQQER